MATLCRYQWLRRGGDGRGVRGGEGETEMGLQHPRVGLTERAVDREDGIPHAGTLCEEVVAIVVVMAGDPNSWRI